MDNDFSKSNNRTAVIKIFIYVIFALLVLIFIVNTFAKDNKEYKLVESLYDIPEPIQVNIISGFENIEINGLNVSIQKLASYNIKGKILSRVIYSDDISPADYVIGWGPFTKGDVSDKFVSTTSYANRFASFQFPDKNWVLKSGGDDYVSASVSNNHLIPATGEVEKKIKSAKIGDYVEITGYLVFAKWEENGQHKKWGPSSLVRTDTSDNGNNNCEIIYVEDIAFLKQK